MGVNTWLTGLAGVAVVSAFVGTAQAAPTFRFDQSVVPPGVAADPSGVSPAGFVINDMIMVTDPGQFWTNAELKVELTQGRFYNAPSSVGGGNVRANDPFPLLVPVLDFDTAVQTYASPHEVVTRLISLDGVSQPPIFSDTVVNVGWATTEDDNIGEGPIARLTISPDAQGRVVFALSFQNALPSESEGRSVTSGTNNGTSPRVPNLPDFFVINGAIVVPEPTSMALIAVPAAMLLGRRRRA